jgi:mitogen-activated protein kinase kinase kinase 7
MTKKRIGTWIYMAPEVIFNQKYTSKCDIYSLGITLYEMYTRRRPYEGMKKEDVISEIRNGLRPVMSDEVDEEIRSIIKR